MVDPPTISVIVPTCDRSEATIRCLESLAGQTFPDFEIVVVDDGSADETPETIARFSAAHPALRVVALRNARNLGANASRNRGVRASTGRFIAFTDSDCVVAPDWLERLLAGFDERTGAVTGLVRDPPPRSVYDLAFRGTHRVPGPGPARRIVAGNLCVRREPLLACTWIEDAERPPQRDGRPDTSYSGACDEESIYLDLRKAGWEIRACPDATVLHEHHYDRRAFFRQAYHGGRAAAEHVRRHRLPPRIDMVPFIAAYGALPPAAALVPWLGPWPLLAPGAAFAAALAAITYNDLVLKGKTIGETVRSFPVLLAYYHVRVAGYVLKTIRMRAGTEGARP